MTALSIVEGLIEAGKVNARAALDEAIGFANDAQTAASTVITSLPDVPNPTEPSVVIPPFNPNVDLSGEFTRAYDDAVAAFGPDLQSKLTAFLDNYFPKFDECLKTSVDEWICNTITVGGTGIPAAVEDQIWARSNEREAKEASRQKDIIVRQFAGRGFDLPPGTMAAQLAMIDQDAANKISTHSRDVAIKQAEIEIENIRFAVGTGVSLRLGIVNAMVSYLNTFMRPWELGIQKAAALVDAKARLWQTSATYYSALIAAAELTLRYDELRIRTGLHQGDQYVTQITSLVNARVNAAISAAESLGQMAAAAMGAQASLGNVAHQTVEGTE